jgi:LPS-assembly lipoprotein
MPKIKSQLVKILLASLLGLSLATGCGFKLRGEFKLPQNMSVIYIKSQLPVGVPPGSVARSLEQRAAQAKRITLTSDPKKADLIVEILQESVRRRTIASGPEGEQREYTLFYDVDYRAIRSDGTVLVPLETLSASRDVLYNETEVLGRDEGEGIAIRDMVSDLTSSIIRRLQATIS